MESGATCFVGRVLMVEDNSINRVVARELLEQLGVQFEFAEDGAEALDKLNAGTFDLVLMDCVMPRMDGYAATERWREKEQSAGARRTPIVAVSANVAAEDRARCIAAGMDDFLGKPINLAGLRQVLARYLASA